MTSQSAVLSSSLHTRVAARSGSLAYMSNLRVFATVVVIAHHVGQAYGPTGGEWPIQEPVRAAILGPFFTVNRSFGMSLFFLIAGYFMVRSYDAHGPAAFVRSRLVRLGIPLTVFMLLSVPFMMLMGAPSENGAFFGVPAPHAIHLWFVQHLLIFSLIYAAGRVLLARGRLAAPTSPARELAVPRASVIILFALGLAVVSAVIRHWWPIDQWVVLPGLVRVAFADVPRDLSFFIIGALAYRHDWLARLPARTGRAWLAFGLVLAVFWYVYTLRGGGALSDNSSLGYAVWESLLCSAMCIGLIVLFRDIANIPTPLTVELGRSQYLAYVIHLFPVLALQAVALALPAPAIAKFVFVSVAAVGLTFLLASLLRRPLRL